MFIFIEIYKRQCHSPSRAFIRLFNKPYKRQGKVIRLISKYVDRLLNLIVFGLWKLRTVLRQRELAFGATCL